MRAIEAVLRYLVHRSPFYAESVYAFVQAHKNVPQDKWIEVRSPEHTGWFYFSGGSGRYTGKRPVGVTEEEMLIELRNAGPNFALREAYKSLIADLPAGPERNHYYAILPGLYEMSDGTFELRESQSFVERCIAELERTQGAGGQSAFSRFLDNYTVGLVGKFLDYRVPGYYAGEMTLLNYAWRDVAWIPLFAIKASGTTFRSGRQLLSFVFKSMLENEGPQRIEAACKQLHDEARQLVASAQQSTDLNQFFGELFVSCALFYGANAGYAYLADADLLLAPYRQAQRSMETACEEFFVTASSSLSNEMENCITGGRQLKRHIQQISDLRRDKGELAAQLRVTELTDIRLYYPLSMKPMLLGGSAKATDASSQATP